MNPQELLRMVDSIHREKNIDSELVIQAIEAALVTAGKRHFGEMADVTVSIAREGGVITASCDGRSLDQEEIGRIGAQTARQIITQKIREAERDARMDEFQDQVGQLVTGIVQRTERGVTIVQLGQVEAILPRSEQIPGESYHNGERVRAVVYEVKAAGNRIKVILSRTKATLIQRLFEQEIPEIADGVIEIKGVSREPGYRSKVAVTSSDTRVDCVGACVGMRGNRIKNVTGELAGERIDIVRWSDDPIVLITNSLQPAEVQQVLLCDMIGRAIALVGDDQLSQAIGRYGQNVRLASKLCGWDIEIMTADELEKQIDRAMKAFLQIEGMTEELAQRLVEQGYLSYDDLSVIEPDALMELGGLTEDEVNAIVEQADIKAEENEVAENERKRFEKAEKERLATEALNEAERKEAAKKDSIPSEADDNQEKYPNQSGNDGDSSGS
jgi:transcription termination/antitermination protein NusA